MIHMLLYTVILIASFSMLVLLRLDISSLSEKNTWRSYA